MRTRQPESFWDWMRSLHQAGLSAGAVTTGTAWATFCWDWPQHRTEDEVLAYVRPPSLEAFRLHHRREVTERTIRRHLARLQELGLLARRRGHSRWGPNVYVPRLPAVAVATVPDSGHQGPELGVNSGHQEPVLKLNSGHPGPVLDANTGHWAPQHRTLSYPSPISPEESQNPPPSSPMETGSTPVESTAGRGGAPTAPKDAPVERVLDGIQARMPPENSADLSPGWRDLCRWRVQRLLDAGWGQRMLADKIVGPSSSWKTAADSDGVVIYRLDKALQRKVPGRDDGAVRASAERRAAEAEAAAAAVSGEAVPALQKALEDLRTARTSTAPTALEEAAHEALAALGRRDGAGRDFDPLQEEVPAIDGGEDAQPDWYRQCDHGAADHSLCAICRRRGCSGCTPTQPAQAERQEVSA